MTTRTFVAAGALAVGLIAVASPAAAHVTPSETSGPAGGYLTFDLRVPHGCGEAGNTTVVEVRIPDGVNSVTPQVVPGWTVERTVETLEPPIDDGHGGRITERTSVITWRGGPLAHDQLEEFGLSVRLPDEPGRRLAFPTIQTCDDGGTEAWIQLVEDGEPEPESPAPVIEVTAADAAGHGTTDTPVEPADNGDHDDHATGLAIAGIVLGALGLVTGGAALLRGRARA